MLNVYLVVCVKKCSFALILCARKCKLSVLSCVEKCNGMPKRASAMEPTIAPMVSLSPP